MARRPQRTVEASIVDLYGVITAQELLALSDDSWGLMRDRITDRRSGKDGLRAKCMACESPVYIRSSKHQNVPRPLFQHYSGGDPTCPWAHEPTMRPDDARAAQYQGRQESNFHRYMCEQVAELVALDPRHISHSVDQYLPPTESEYGRFPDVYVEWEGYGSFAVEFQMSGTFQTEISARCKHYEREGIPIIWILFGLETNVDLSQSVRDVIRRHRGNAFVLDQKAIVASREQRTLVLSCLLKNAQDKLEPPELVRFDELTIPRSKVPYYEDRIVGPKLATIKDLRQPWFEALGSWEDRYYPICGLDRPQSLLVATAFSIVATAAKGKVVNYASEQNSISALLNTYLNNGDFARFTDLITHLIKSTAIAPFIKPSVWKHMQDHSSPEQADQRSPEWTLLRQLLPEALDPILREELSFLDALPPWAST